MKISPVALCYTTPWLKQVVQHVPAFCLYRFCRFSTAFSARFSPHTKRFLRPLRSIVSYHLSEERLAEMGRKYLVYRKYLNYIEATWQHLERRQRPPAIVDGAQHLHDALSNGAGVVLISGHNYGFSRMIGPILAADGYQICRAGSLSLEVVQRRWGPNTPWEYVYLPKASWERLRALKQLFAALKNNRIVHILILNRPCGAEKMAVDFYGRNFFLDAGDLELISGLRAPVLPCFALCDEHGAFTVKIHPPLGNSTEELAVGFAKLFSQYLRESPEYVRFWKPLLNQKEFW